MAPAQQIAPARIQYHKSYSTWDQPLWRLENELVSILVVDGEGGRPVGFNLSGHIGLFVLPAGNGPGAGTPYGGNSNWPEILEGPSRGGPRPGLFDRPVKSVGPPTGTSLEAGPDSVQLSIQGSLAVGQQGAMDYERRMTLYKASSRVRVLLTMANKGDRPYQGGRLGERAYYQVEQGGTAHKVYLPLNRQSLFGPSGFHTAAPQAPTWLGEAIEGVFVAQYMPMHQELVADPGEGWLCFVDEKAGVAYCKTFAEGAALDGGNEIIVDMQMGVAPAFVRLGVFGPPVDWPKGATREVVLHWATARVDGPILQVDSRRIVTQWLSLAEEGLSGGYGVFYQGEAQVVVVDLDGEVLAEGPRQAVSPLDEVVIDLPMDFPAGTDRAELWLWDWQGQWLGVMDSVEIR